MKLLGATVVPVEQRLAHAQGRAQRSHARLGDQRRGHLLHHRHRGRPRPVPAHGARLQRDYRARVRANRCWRTTAASPIMIACVGGGSNAIGLFHPYINDREVKLYGAEAAGDGIDTGRHAASMNRPAAPACCTATAPTCCTTTTARSPKPIPFPPAWTTPASARSMPACPTAGRAQYVGITDEEALAAFHRLRRIEGIMPALESAHAMAQAIKLARDVAERRADAVQPVRPGRQGHAYRGRLQRHHALRVQEYKP